MVPVGDVHCDGAADGGAVAQASDDVDRVGLDPLARAATVARLSARELRVDEGPVDGQARRQATQDRREARPV